MKFSAQLSSYLTTWDDIRAVVETLEIGPWHGVYFSDHFVPPNRPNATEADPAYEAFSLIAAVASMTERLRLGHLVLGNTYRNPALVAKMAGTIDHISHGRFTLGIGAGWFQREHEAYGWDFPSMRERSDRLEEACALIRDLFTSKSPVDFEGHYYRLDRASLSPGPVQKPRIPIMVGGTGERRTLRTLAKYGDVFNFDGFAARRLGGMSLELYQHKVEVLNRRCEDVGRDPGEIRLTALVPARLSDDQGEVEAFVARVGPGTIAGGAEHIVNRVGELVNEGVDEIMLGGTPNDPREFKRLEEEIIAAFD